MNKFIEYIKSGDVFIGIFVIVMIILVYIFAPKIFLNNNDLEPLTNMQEQLNVQYAKSTNTTQCTTNSNLISLANSGTSFYLKCKDSAGTYNYVSITPVSVCTNYVSSNQLSKNDCDKYMATLQPTSILNSYSKNKYCLFKLISPINKNNIKTYVLTGKTDDIGNVNFSQLLNIAGQNKVMCFYPGTITNNDAGINFEIIESLDGKYNILKFVKNNINFYVTGPLDSNAVCIQNLGTQQVTCSRLCVTTDKTKAIQFEIECVTAATEPFEDNFDNFDNFNEHTSIIPNESMYSLNQSNTNSSVTLSLPGAEPSHYEHFLEL